MYDVRRAYDSDPELKEEDVRQIADWIGKQPHLPQIPEWQVILFLHSCYYSSEKAKATIDTYFTVKTHCADILGNRNPNDAILAVHIGRCAFMISDTRTEEGYVVLYLQLTDKNPDKFGYSEYLRLCDMLISAWQYRNGPAKGWVMVVDQINVVLGHLAKMNILTTKKFLYYLQEALPVRLKAIHVMNTVPFIDKMMLILRPFMKKELLDMLYFHNTNETMFKSVPQKCLPKDYGGSEPDTKGILDEFAKLLQDNKDLFEFEDKQRVDESKRAGKPKSVNDIFGVEGTFKKLDID